MRITDEGEEISNELGPHSKLRTHRLGVSDLHAFPDNLHDVIVPDTLSQILVVCPDADLLDARIVCGEIRRGRETIIRFELDHRPDRDAHSVERFLERMKL